MASASCGRSLLNSCRKASKRACCCKLLMPGGRVVSVLRVRCMRSWRPFCCGWPGLMRSMANAEAQPLDGELGEVEQGIRTGERDAVVGADRLWQAALAEELFEGGEGRRLAHRGQRLAHQEVA